MKPALYQHQESPIQPGQVVEQQGRLVLVERVTGSDPAAPVLVVEIAAIGAALPGQMGMWPMRAFSDPASGRRVR